MVMIGNWNNSSYGKALKSKYAAMECIHLLDPIYDKKQLNLLRSNCFVYLHGHSAGGTNPSLVEAMNLGLPVIAYDVLYNRETTENEAIYFKDSAELLTALDLVNNNTRKRLGKKMYAISKRRYTWRIIAEKYKKMLLKETEGTLAIQVNKDPK